MSGAAVFRLTRHGRSLAEVRLGAAEQVGNEAQAPSVHEQQVCGFTLEDREPEVEYRLRLGDRGPVSAETSVGPSGVGAARGPDILWEDRMYFDGARGRVWVQLSSRPEGSDAPWTPRARLPIYVVATKLSEERYRTMLGQMRRLSAGLLFDLTSPMLRQLCFGQVEGAVSSRSSQVELRLLERLWAALAPSLQQVAREPVTRISRAAQTRMSWGGERLGARAVARLAAAGLDPRHRSVVRPFPALQERYVESLNTVEHQVIAGLLQFLGERVSACVANVRRHVGGIEADRTYRERPPAGGPSLYQTEDLPRLERLRRARRRARLLARSIARAQALELFRDVPPRFSLPATAVFEHVRPYRRIRDEFRRYLRSSLLLLEDGFEERLKSTQRLYEQWVFFQLAGAFRRAGLRCASHDGLFQRSSLFRFTLDVDRGARLTFLAPDGQAVVVRFEPWVLPHAAAKQRRDTVYRGRQGETPWSPDVLIEFLEGSRGEGVAGEVRYAVVVDAKYTARIQEHHWTDTRKYLEIRATGTRAAIVKQVWLAYPDERAEITPEDSAISWTEDGPDWGPGEVVMGKLGMIPAATEPADADDEPGWITTPETVVQSFVDGLLKFLHVPVQTR